MGMMHAHADALDLAADVLRDHVPRARGLVVACTCGTELASLDDWAGHTTLMLTRAGVIR